MSDKDNSHFSQIYIYIILTTLIACGYLFLATFSTIPDKNWHIVDITVGFFLGTVISSGIGYLLGGNPTAPSKKPEGSLPINTDAINFKNTTTKLE